MDDIEKRLRETSEQCLSNFTAWKNDQKNSDVREALHEAIHELRKVASRLEIELAINERDQLGHKPIPIPPHRDAQNRSYDLEHDMPDFNTQDNDNSHNNHNAHKGHRRMQRGPGGGGPRRHQGGGGGGSNRRPGRDE